VGKESLAMKTVWTICLAVLLAGCALTEDQVAVQYNAPANTTRIQDAALVAVSVTAQDGRVSYRDRVSTKKNGYGMEMAKIVASNDVVELVRGAVEKEFGAFGLNIGANDLQATVDLQVFYNDFKIGFFAGDAVAEVSFNLTVRSPQGNILYSRSYRGVGTNKDILLAMGEQALPALQAALSKAMEQFVADAGLHAALEQAARQRRVPEGPKKRTS